MDFCGEPQDLISTQQDNLAAILVALTGDSKSGKLKHILAKIERVREAVHTGLIDVQWTPSNAVKADCLTKPIQGHRFKEFVNDILHLDAM